MDHELLDIVDRSDNIIGVDTKNNKIEKELITRNVGVFIKDSDGKFIIVKRSPNKKSFPNKLDLAACGNVSSNESYEDAAARELSEELSIKCELKLLKKIYHEGPENGKVLKYFTSLFIGACDDEIVPNEEFSQIVKMSLEDLKDKINNEENLFCPFFVEDFRAVEDLL